MLETTRIYIADVSILKDASVFESFLKKIPEYRQKKAMSFKFDKGKMQSLGVGLLLQLACKEAGLDGADEHIAYGENGKPFLVDFPDVQFNLSHSGERVMAVISPFEVGCDVEIIKGDRGRLAERFFKPEESAWIKSFESLPAHSEAFYRLWTLKECYLPCTLMNPKIFRFTTRANALNMRSVKSTCATATAMPIASRIMAKTHPKK